MPQAYFFQGKYGLLTYAQCGTLDPLEVVNHLSGLGAECILGRENHADGGLHLHAMFIFERKRNFRRSDTFDVHGRHPNVLTGRRTPEAMWDYATKDGDVVGGGLDRPTGNPIPEAGNKWAEIILSETRDEFFDAIAKMDPRALVTSFPSLCKYADWKYRETRDPYQHPAEFTFNTEDLHGVDEFLGLLGGNSGGRRSHPPATDPPFGGYPGAHGSDLLLVDLGGAIELFPPHNGGVPADLD